MLDKGLAGPQVKRKVVKKKVVKRPAAVVPVQRSGGRWMAAAVMLAALAGVAVTESTGVTNLRGAIGQLIVPEHARAGGGSQPTAERRGHCGDRAGAGYRDRSIRCRVGREAPTSVGELPEAARRR